MIRPLRLSLCFLLALIAVSPAFAATIEVIPFTTAETLRVVTRVSDAKGNFDVTGEVVSLPGRERLWSGALGSGRADQKSTDIEKTIANLKPKLWSPGAPNLYELAVTVRSGSQVVGTEKCRIGFRTFTYKDGHFLLNGHPIFMRGLAINPPGRGEPKELGHSRQFAYDYVKYMKGQHLNLIRPSEADQDWFDACDEMGMMIYTGFYGSPPTGLTKEEEAQQKLENQDEAEGKRLPRNFEKSMAAYQKEFETYARHPSIVIYILSNEMPYKGKTGELVHDFLSKAYDHLSKWDRTRLYIGNAGYGEGHEGDVNDVHRYWGWYYNSFTTYYNLRDPHLFGDYEKNQPFTFSECVGNFTGPTGAYNYIERKQLAAALGWTGHKPDQVKEAQEYQGFMVKQATESFRRMREENPRISGLMPFTICFHNWRGITAFDQMKPTAAAKQFGTSYQPVLLSWEHWQPNVYAGAKTPVFAHVINDADDFSDLSGAKLVYELRGKNGKSIQSATIDIPTTKYYAAWRQQIDLEIPQNATTGEYTLHGEVRKGDKLISKNDSPIFIAGTEWKNEKGDSKRNVTVFDPKGATTKALAKLGIEATSAKQLNQLNPQRDLLIIGEEAGKSLAPAKKDLQAFIRAGGRVLCLGQDHSDFDPSWLPVAIKLVEHSVNEHAYMTVERPARDQTHVNVERPDHPIFKGLDRDRFVFWSDYTNWDQSKKDFPRISPMRFGYKVTEQNDLSKIAILANYDQALSGIAVGEMFDGKGSVILTGLDIVGRVGIDPVADRMLVNLVHYMGGDEGHAKYPLVKDTIKWGDFQSENGVISGNLCGIFRNTKWLVPPTDPDAKSLPQSQAAWNTKPGDQFVPDGIRPRGPYTYSFNCAPKDTDKNAKTGTGIFYVTIPSGRRTVVSKVRNPSKDAGELVVEVNGKKGEATKIPAGQTVTIRSSIPGGATDIGVRYTGEKDLVIEETSFE
jgi:hypothetical protein